MPAAGVYGRLLDRMTEPVAVTDTAFRVRYVNAAAARCLERSRAEVVGRPLSDFLPGRYDSGPPDAGSGWRFERLAQGWAAFGPLRTAASVVDEEWVQRMVDAEQLAAVGQLAASVAHEIGAPLTAISVAVEYLLKRECGTCQFAGRDLEVILTQTRRIAQLSRRLVDLARPGEPELRPIDLNRVIAEGFELLEKQLARSGIKTALLLEPALPLLHGDADQLQQVLLNLVLNAQRAMAQGGGRLEVSTRLRRPNVELVVADTGPGIAAADVPKIFLPFFSRSGGTGLGLPLARQIVHKHGGSIEVESVPGAGAVFKVRLPVGQP